MKNGMGKNGMEWMARGSRWAGVFFAIACCGCSRDPRALMNRMSEAYRAADRYRDDATVHIHYTRGDREVDHELPFRVAFERPDRLRPPRMLRPGTQQVHQRSQPGRSAALREERDVDDLTGTDLLGLAGDDDQAVCFGQRREQVRRRARRTAESLDEALARRPELGHGQTLVTPEGHTVSSFAVAFYAPDSEQAGMLARAQEIENLEREVRAQGLLTDEARATLVRMEAAYSEAAQQLTAARREAAGAAPPHACS